MLPVNTAASTSPPNQCGIRVGCVQKHSDVQPGNICVGALPGLPGRPMVTLIDHGGSSPDDGVSGCHMETLEYTPEPMLAAPSSHGEGPVYYDPAECRAVTSAKSDVAALGFVAMEMLLGQLPPALTRQGCQAKGVPAHVIKPAILELRWQFRPRWQQAAAALPGSMSC